MSHLLFRSAPRVAATRSGEVDRETAAPDYLTDFENEIGSETRVMLPDFVDTGDFEKFRAKARAFLRAHHDHVAIRKLRMNATGG